MMSWCDEQATMGVDPERGPSWRMAVGPFLEGGAAVTLVVSHSLSDVGGILFSLFAALAGMNPDLELDQFLGQPCWIGLDLASKTDIAALVMLFQHPDTPDAFVVFGKYYLPEDTVQAAGNSQYQ